LGQPITAKERAAQTHKHPQTVRRYVRRFEVQGMLGLFDKSQRWCHAVAM
jgi:DNA-binding IclR family transcriptional regulator